MPTFNVSSPWKKSQQELWNVIADFPNIARWHPGVKHSESSGAATGGVGAERVCRLSPAGVLDERVLEWEEPNTMVIAVDRATKVPVKSTVSTFTLTETGDGAKLGIHVDFVPKGGPIGKLFSPLLARGLKRGMNGFLEAWDRAA